MEILDLAQLYHEMPTELTTPHRAEFYQILWFQEGTKWVHTVNSGDDFGWAETTLVGDAVINGQACKQFSRRYKLCVA